LFNKLVFLQILKMIFIQSFYVYSCFSPIDIHLISYLLFISSLVTPSKT